MMSSPDEPWLRVLRGAPNDDEIAAATAVLLGLANQPQPEQPSTPSAAWTKAGGFAPPGAWTSARPEAWTVR